jgi:hypothetical protein
MKSITVAIIAARTFTLLVNEGMDIALKVNLIGTEPARKIIGRIMRQRSISGQCR